MSCCFFKLGNTELSFLNDNLAAFNSSSVTASICGVVIWAAFMNDVDFKYFAPSNKAL